MSDIRELERSQVRMPEHRFKQILEPEYRYPPRVAASLMEEAQECLQGSAGANEDRAGKCGCY